MSHWHVLGFPDCLQKGPNYLNIIKYNKVLKYTEDGFLFFLKKTIVHFKKVQLTQISPNLPSKPTIINFNLEYMFIPVDLGQRNFVILESPLL